MAAAIISSEDAQASGDVPAVVAPLGDATTVPAKPSHKSFRRKYRKIRHEFDQVMKKNEGLFKQEQQCQDTLRRLAEENDLLLDLLLDANTCVDIPVEHRFTLGSPDEPIQSSEPLADASSGPADFISLLKKQPVANKASLPAPLSDDIATLLTLYKPDPAPPKEKSHRNSVSVYNWLRRNQPQVFLQDGEEGKSKKDALTPTTASTKHLKRASIVTKNSEEGNGNGHDAMEISTPLSVYPPQTPATQTNGTLKRKRRPSTPEEAPVEDEELRAYSGYGTLAAGSKRKRVDDVSSSSHISSLVERERERERSSRAAKLAEQGIVPGNRGRGRQANGF